MIATALFVAAIGAVLALFWTMQRQLMYFPAAYVPTPDEIGLMPVEPVTFKTADGLELSAWFLAASGPSPPFTVLVFNGNAGTFFPVPSGIILSWCGVPRSSCLDGCVP